MPCAPAIADKDLAGLTKLIRHPLFGLFYRHRFVMVASLCPEQCDNTLEIGYGAGYMAYALSPRCRSYTGIDIHGFDHEVNRCLHDQGRDNVTLMRDDARRLESVDDSSVDLVVSVSCLEHIREVGDVQQAIWRVLKPGGLAAYGLPQKNRLTKWLFAALGYDDEAIHPTSPVQVADAAREAGFVPLRQRFLPPPALTGLEMYWAGLFQKPGSARS